MTKMIERVAEAMRLRAIERGHPIHPVVAHHLAAAAIEAMLEPTNEMHRAMCECYNSPVCIWMTGIKHAIAVPNGDG